jgi:asparagine synthase (glutamine-hydrolysing)
MYRDKMGFAVPISEWFRGPLRQRVGDSLQSEVLADTGMFDMTYLKKLVDQHQSGMAEHSPALWALLMFESSLRNLYGIADNAKESRAASA